MENIKQGDEVVVVAGRDKGRRGSVSRIIPAKQNSRRGMRAYVDGINMVKKHQKGNPQTNSKGGIVEVEASIDISNLALWDPFDKKASRVGFRALEDGRMVRYYKSSGEIVDSVEN